MDVTTNTKKVPKLRFPEFEGEWHLELIGAILERVGDAVQVDPEAIYREIGVRSHGRGVFHKDEVTGRSLGDKRVFHVVPNAFVLNIVFAWEQAVAMTTDSEKGFIASHRFPMFIEKSGKSYLPFVRELFLRKRGKYLLELASPGGAGRNKTLGQQEFLKLKTNIPKRDEQKKIAAFLGAVDKKLVALKAKRDLLTDYKRGVMQQVFSQQLRFKRDDGSEFPNWEDKRLGEVATFSKGKGISKADISNDGVLPCIRYGELYTLYSEVIEEVASRTDIAADELSLSQANDVIVPASGEDRLDMARACCVMHSGVALGGDLNVLRSEMSGVFLAYYLSNAKRKEIARFAQGNSIVHLYGTQLKIMFISVPHPDEQKKIADFLSALDAKIDAIAAQIAQMKAFKKGLLQQMFV